MAPGLTVAELVDLGDLDELLRRVDDLCDDRDWPGLVDLRDRCRAAYERGRQLWPAASHAEYRLALQAPGRWAATVVQPGAGRFALGPLSEVAASTHSWDELAAHLSPTPEAALVAQERVLRGEDLRGEARVDPAVVELPLALEQWEPAYPLVTYKPYQAEFDDVPPPPLSPVPLPARTPARQAAAAAEPEALQALLDLVTPWTTQSNGQARAVAVQGNGLAAIAALATDANDDTGDGDTVRIAEVDAGHALAVMAWAGASGGAHGRRRGMAQGRFGAWWAAAALARQLDRWPVLDEAIESLRWYRWDRAEPASGWVLRLAVERPADGVAFTIEATDHR